MIDRPVIKKYDKRKVQFVTDVAGVPNVVKSVKVRHDAETVRYRKTTFPFNIDKPSYREKNVFIYIVDIRKGQLSFQEKDFGMSPELLDSILVRSLGKQLIASLENKPLMGELIMIIISAAFGICFGYILGNSMPLS